MTTTDSQALRLHDLPKWTRTENVDTLLLEKHDTPLVTFVITFNAGAYFDPAGKSGLANFTARMLGRGTAHHTREQIEEELDFLGASVSVDVGFQSLTLQSQVLSRNLPALISLLAEMLREPAFSPEEIEKLRQEQIARLYLRLEDDAGLARKFFTETVFGNHPYARETTGEIKTLKAITREDAVQFHRDYFDRKGLILGGAGDLDRKTFDGVAAELVKALPKGSIDRKDIPFTGTVHGRNVILVDKPDRTQTHFLIGEPAIDINNRDFHPLSVFVTAFAGRMFQAQYMQEIRVKRGWSYGAAGSLDARKDGGAFYLYTYPATKDTLAAISLSLDLLEKAVNGPSISDDQIEFAKKFLARGFPFVVDTPEKVVTQMINDRFLGRPSDYLKNYVPDIEAVTPQAARDAARRHMNSKDLFIVVLCTAKDFQETIGKELGAVGVTTVPFDKM